MPTIRHLAELFEALAANDRSRAESAAKEVIAQEQKKGHRTAAQILRGALHPNGRRQQQPMEPAVQDPVLLSSALSRLDTAETLNDVMLRPRWRRELEYIVREWKHRSKLAHLNIARRSRLLFHGPPGCGKSLAARALGHDLRLPTYLVRFDAIIGAYLGQTAVHLRQLFHFAEATPCVLVFDEIDALGKKRGNPLDVGELDRIVISLMQELEHSRPEGLVIATSNLPSHLDDALWRRFDLVAEFPRPNRRELDEYLKTLRLASEPHIKIRRKLPVGVSYADAKRLVEEQVRLAVLDAV